MKLVPDLEAHFVRHLAPGWVDPVSGEVYASGGLQWVEALAQADGVWFLCPKCFAAHDGRIGTHAVLCWFTGKVADDVHPGPGRWTPSGTGLDDLTFIPGEPPRAISVALTGGCGWHGFVSHGQAA
jgi:hypothetical protein